MKKIFTLITAISISANVLFAQQMVEDIQAGAGNASPSNLSKIGDKLFFTPINAVVGVELWKSDGTAAGTDMIKDIQAGSSHGLAFTSEIIELNGKAIFGANDGTHGTELWISDGFESGTKLLKDIYDGTDFASGSNPKNFAKVGNEVFFNAKNGPNNEELYKTDGTTAGTVLVKEIHPSARSNPQFLTEMNGKLYFSASDGQAAESLWVSDGTAAGTKAVKTNGVGVALAPENITKIGNLIYFTGGSGSGRELWKSDGTEAGTVMVKDIATGAYQSSSPYSFRAVGNTLYFKANSQELWKSDGTEAGTVMVSSNFDLITEMTSFKNTLYFVGQTMAKGSEIYYIDTNGSPQLLKDINTGSGDGVATHAFLTVHGSKLYFQGDDNDSNYILWQTDGTEAGTIAVPTAPTTSFNPSYMISVGNKLFYSAQDAQYGEELWVFDNLSSTVITEEACPSYTFDGVEYTQAGTYELSYTNVLGYDSIVTLRLTICGVVGISNVEDFEVNIFPNPVENVLNINTTETLSSIKLINLNGQNIEVYNNNSKQINFSGVSTGIYFLELLSGDKKSMIKIIKK